MTLVVIYSAVVVLLMFLRGIEITPDTSRSAVTMSVMWTGS